MSDSVSHFTFTVRYCPFTVISGPYLHVTSTLTDIDREAVLKWPQKFGASFPLAEFVVDEPIQISLIKTWVDTCITEHDPCAPDTKGFMPTRLIDVGGATVMEARSRSL